MDKVDYLEKSLSRLSDSIVSADSRVRFVTTVNFALVGLIAFMFEKLEFTTFSYYLSALSYGAILKGMFHIYKCFFPKFHPVGKEESLVFFGSIAQMDKDSFHSAVDNYNKEAYMRDLKNACFASSQIVNRKFIDVRKSFSWMLISFILCVITFFSTHLVTPVITNLGSVL